ncbi:hypothetical protein [Nannocystis pusilla]|uniref:hypothetical protein n=1 Tax=Nannocystis pusilla TaxID=889268 RepID=UPI003DA2D657
MDQALDERRRGRVELGEHAVHLRVGVEQDPRGPHLVARRARQHRLEGVAERPVPEVVQQRGREGDVGPVIVDAIVRRELLREGADAIEVALHDVHGADGVGEARVLAAGEGERSEAERADPSQPLNLGAVEQPRDEAGGGAAEGDQAMHGIAQEHRAEPTSGAGGWRSGKPGGPALEGIGGR